MKTYGVGVLGCGAVWEYHRQAIEKSDQLRCVAVYDPNVQRAKEAAAKAGAAALEGIDAVIEHPDVEIVALLTPALTHLEQVTKAAAAGKHLMLEKPLSVTLDDAQQIVDSIDNAGVKCFHPTLRALASDLYDELVKWTAPDGPVGPVRAAFYHMVAYPYAPSKWLLDRRFCYPPSEYDPHVFDTFLALTGDEPKAVTAVAGNYARDIDQDDVNSIHVDFRGGRHLQFDVHWVVDPTWKLDPTISFEIACERGLIRHHWFGADWHNAGAQGSFKSTRQATGGDRWDHYHELIAAIETGKDIHPNHHDGLKYVAIQDAAMRSVKERRTIDL